MPTTMKDVAAHLGISSSTVSRAVNNTGYVSEEMRAKISDAISALEYQPNLLARGLRKKSTSLIGLIVPDLMNPYYTGIAQTIENLLAAREFRMILSLTNDNPMSELLYLQEMQKQRVAGIIISTSGHNQEYLNSLSRAGLPIVAHMREIRSRTMDNVGAPDCEGAQTAVNHLVGLGHRRIGILCGPQILSTGRNRLMGYQQALKAAGIAADTRLIKIGAFRRPFAIQATGELLDLNPRPTAIFAAGGELTAGLLKMLHERGVRVPEDMSVVGYDDPEWFSFWTPPITSVTVPVDKLSEATVDLLVRRVISGKPPGRGTTVRIPLSFTVRSSSAPICERTTLANEVSKE